LINPLFDNCFKIHADKNTPLLHLENKKIVTHREFLGMAAQMANAFLIAGLNPGDRLAIQIEKSEYALAIYVACIQSGIIFLPLNPAYTPNEVSYFLTNSGARLIICEGKNAVALREVAGKSGSILETLNTDGTGTLRDMALSMPKDFSTVPRKREDLAAILYTSGTTGRSKGAMLTQDNLLSNAETLKNYWKFSNSDVLLHALPIFHTHGLFVASNVTFISGGSMIFLPRFDASQLIDLMPQATVLMGVPTFYTRLIENPQLSVNTTKNMRLFISGSAPLLAETHLKFEKITGHRILERYGMTETNMNTSNPYEGERRAGTVGFPLPNIELKITNPITGENLANGEIGQIEVRGSNVFAGYWRMEDKTREDLREDGFFTTGDLGLIDSDGYVQIVGRNKDLIISGGYNIYPKEIELILDDQPGVLESAVIGIPNSDFGESVVGCLIPEKGVILDLDLIQKAICKPLAKFKHPRKLLILKELPRNTMGKVQKNLLRSQFKGILS